MNATMLPENWGIRRCGGDAVKASFRRIDENYAIERERILRSMATSYELDDGVDRDAIERGRERMALDAVAFLADDVVRHLHHAVGGDAAEIMTKVTEREDGDRTKY